MGSKGAFKAILEARALLRKGATGRAEEAALLYARAQGWTEEDGIDAEAVGAELNALLDGMEPEEWEEMEKAAARIGDATFRGVVSYAVRRIGERNAEETAALARKLSPSPDKGDSDRS